MSETSGAASRHSTIGENTKWVWAETRWLWRSKMSDRTKRQNAASLNRVTVASSSRPAARLVASLLVLICRRPFPALWLWPLSRSLGPHLGPPVRSPGFSRRSPVPAKTSTPSPMPELRSLFQRRRRLRELAHYSRPECQLGLTPAATVQGVRLGPCSRDSPHGQDSGAAFPSHIAHLRCWGVWWARSLQTSHPSGIRWESVRFCHHQRPAERQPKAVRLWP
jgi:hypothetical protein